VGLSFRPATPPESSSDILGFRQKVIEYEKVSYLSTHSESDRGYSSMQSKLHTANYIQSGETQPVLVTSVLPPFTAVRGYLPV
jgi:hypothetical protein